MPGNTHRGRSDGLLRKYSVRHETGASSVTAAARAEAVSPLVVLSRLTDWRAMQWNLTEHPTADCTVQQFRAVVPGDQPQRFLIHDRDSIYAAAVCLAIARTAGEGGPILFQRTCPSFEACNSCVLRGFLPRPSQDALTILAGA